MRREPLSAKEGIDGCKQSDRQGGGGGCQPYGAWKSRFLSINHGREGAFEAQDRKCLFGIGSS